MPCRSDHMEPRPREEESKRVAHFLSYCLTQTGLETPDWIALAAQDLYGNEDKCDELTALLCSLIRDMEDDTREAVVYNAHDQVAREIATWWENHCEWDKHDGR